jgi:hypothetical protein
METNEQQSCYNFIYTYANRAVPYSPKDRVENAPSLPRTRKELISKIKSEYCRDGRSYCFLLAEVYYCCYRSIYGHTLALDGSWFATVTLA